MPSPKRPRSEGQRLYLIFDDWAWGYSIREINLQPAVSPRKRTSPRLRTSPSSASSSSGGKGITIRPRRLPRPFIQLEARRGYPNFFAGVGTKIVATQGRSLWDLDSVPGGFLRIIDVRSRGVNFGPGKVCQDIPIYLPIGDELFSMDMMALRALSLKPLSCPPRHEDRHSSGLTGWSWRELSCLPFQRTNITSYAVHPDEHAILVSTMDDDSGEEATFALHTDKFDMVDGKELAVWTRLGDWSLPFAGRAHFVHCLDAFVGLSKDPATLGHLCSSSCDSKAAAAAANDSPPAETQVSDTPDKLEQPPAATDTDSRPPPVWKLGKEKLFSDDPAETHVGATLVHMGGSEFCLVQCVSIGGDSGNATDPEQVIEELQHKDGIVQHKEEDTNEEDPDKLGELRHKDVIQHMEDANELEEGDSTADDHEQQQQQQQLEKEEGGEAPKGCSKRSSHLYHLTTFSLCYDDNGDLTTGNTCRMQCYKVPAEITEEYFLVSDPVAFWL